MAPDAAMVKAREQIQALLPEGRLTPKQHFKSLVDDASEAVGILWFAERVDGDTPQVFIYDVNVDDRHRGGGLGSAAMALLEEEARRLGAAEVALHVFDHNEGAIRLYERLGYRTGHQGQGGRRMAKTL